MLYLERKIGQSIVIENNITLSVVEVNGQYVKLGFTFPQGAQILRKEIYDSIIAQNIEALNQELPDVKDDIKK